MLYQLSYVRVILKRVHVRLSLGLGMVKQPFFIDLARILIRLSASGSETLS